MTARTHDRRTVLAVGALAGVGLVAAACGGPSRAPEAPKPRGDEGDVSPAEDLMREHGVLDRVLLVYEEGIRRLETAGGSAPVAELASSAKLVRRFVEDYHEKLEEDFLFPRFEKAGKLVGLVTVLRVQHRAGRKVTDAVLQLLSSLPSADRDRQLVASLRSFIRMYRPHAAREDTVLFPALRAVSSAKELEELGERFEEKEHALFGKDGFEGVVAEVAAIEQALGLADLASFTAT